MTKPEIKLTEWRIHGGAISGLAHWPDSDTPVTDFNILKRPMNPKEGDKVETVKTIYILTGDKQS